tara:strand:+ start:270 stop:467 length:198 start_codon:yes stop_codon:yes gene_type:complete
MTECFICKEDKEQLLAIDNKKIDFKATVCFPCVVSKLKEEKQRQAEAQISKLFVSHTLDEAGESA